MTRTKAPEIVTLCGAQWERLPDSRYGMLIAEDGTVVMHEDSLRKLERERQVEAEQAQERRRAAERARAELEAQPRVTVCGIEWLRHPKDSTLLVQADDHGHVMRESRVREIEAERAREAEQAQARRSADRSTLEQRIADLERQLATS
jgi:hypothetical protein